MHHKPMGAEHFTVTIHRTDDRPSVKLLVPRSASEVEALIAKGYRVTTDPPLPNERKPSLFSEALRAISRLRNYAVKNDDAGLRDRADRAVVELLRGSGLSFDDDSDVRPSIASPPPARRELHTIPGIGGRR
jgi:hypothetical protein